MNAELPTARPLYRNCSAAVIVCTVLFSASAVALAAPADDQRTASIAERLRQASAAIANRPRDAATYLARAAIYAAAGDHAHAIEDYDRAIELDPEAAEPYDQRGSQLFMLGHVARSIKDFDDYIKRRPSEEPRHWKRGISYYYAGRFDDGRRQFEGYQNVDSNDVENAVWRFLCMARASGVPAARAAMLKIGRDTRVPMKEIYDFYLGRATSDDVLAAARAGNPASEALNARLFYAQLYLGLYYEVAGEPALAERHIREAAEKHKIGHYMWNVADVHARRLAKGE